ncbi:hypothetical protein EOPP23_07215 [Endozoicomonas sp. OPT23]|uniref:UPF0231 family protein n=1 Tax=Endozoicomonas sp. OPT23 TaxID=2072845 RepID=UPI00129B1033|nr:YacL family protein [Endozoicomonas sp. OPT23]MRI32771.1 hypothetical protein [Endozoicomonas sp. OPT23]
MEYRFQRDYLGNPVAKLSSEHEALGRWLNDEVATNTGLIERLLAIISDLEARNKLEFQLEGHDFNITLTRDSAEASARLLETEMMDDFGEDMDYYDSESSGQCGLDDFKHLLLAWQDYIA